MRLTDVIAGLVLLSAEPVLGHKHQHAHRHAHSHARLHQKVADRAAENVEKRSTTCQLPDDADLHYVPGAMNKGFAMSPDQPCKPGMYCPIACKPGKVMAQWEPGSTYTYPSSMNGGLYCGDDGNAKKPFESQPFCVDGTGTVNVVNKAGKTVSFCQTVLPGNEAMLIPTVIDSTSVLAVPGPSYWGSTAAHYYINPPGVGDEGCIWGDSSKPIGNWAPYVAGANTDKGGQTFLKLGFNPIFEFEGAGLEKNPLKFGVRIECPGGGCNGLPCELDPSKKGLGEVVSNLSAVGAGGSSFCVVTVPSGSKADIVVFNTDGSDASGDDSGGEEEEEEETDEPTTEAAEETPTSSEQPKSTSSKGEPAYDAVPTIKPGLFQEVPEDEESTTSPSGGSSPTSSEPAPKASKPDKNEASGRQQGGAAFGGLVIALAAAACLY